MTLTVRVRENYVCLGDELLDRLGNPGRVSLLVYQDSLLIIPSLKGMQVGRVKGEQARVRFFRGKTHAGQISEVLCVGDFPASVGEVEGVLSGAVRSCTRHNYQEVERLG